MILLTVAAEFVAIIKRTLMNIMKMVDYKIILELP